MLKHKKILITGANGGIGSELCQLLEQEQAKVFKVVVASDNKDDFVFDLSTSDGLKALYKLIDKEEFDIIINLAGINSFAEFAQQSDEEIMKMLDINLTAPMLITKHTLSSYMKKQNRGHIINISSVIGLIPMPYYAAYAASKAGLKAFSEAMHRELSTCNINVSYIAPRAVETKINSKQAVEFMQKTKTNVDSPAFVAEQILKVIKTKQPRMIIGKPETFFSKLNALVPSIVDKDMFKKAKLAKKILTK